MRKETLSKIMRLAWQFVKRNGYTMAKAMRIAWRNIKLRAKMAQGIVKFYYAKVDGSMREAYGTLNPSLMPETKGTERKPNPTLQTYYDTEKSEYRCFKVAHLVKIA